MSEFSVYLFPSAAEGSNGYINGFKDLTPECWWVKLPRVPQIGEEVSVVLTHAETDCERETVFLVGKVTTVFDANGEEPLSFRVHMSTSDYYDDLNGYDLREAG